MLFLLVTIPILAFFIYQKIVKPSNYWKDRDVIHAKSWPLFGSFLDFVLKKKHMIEVIADIYRKFPKERCVGYIQFTRPFLMVRDLDLIQQITVKDFDHFHDSLVFDNIKCDLLLSRSLVNLNGKDWKQMRTTLNRVFTNSKISNMYHLIEKCAKIFVGHFHKGHLIYDMEDLFSRFTCDVIARISFGFQTDSMDDPKNVFFTMGKKFTKFGNIPTIKLFILQLSPSLAKLLRIHLFSKDVGTFFRTIVKNKIEDKEEKGIVRLDLIHLLTEARKELEDETVKECQNVKTKIMELTDDHIVAQALLFFFVGFDTVSTASCFMAHELAVNPDIQEKLLKEIDDVNRQCQGQPSYETLQSMKYLDQVVCETLRKWPPSFQTDRLCVKNYVIEPKNPKEKVVFIEKGVSVVVPIMALHWDPQYYHEPHRFDPERFSDENRTKIVPGSYVPFGIAPTNCIGSSLALILVKTLFFHLLSKFVLMPVEETQFPLKISPKSLTMTPENGFKLGLQPRPVPSY